MFEPALILILVFVAVYILFFIFLVVTKQRKKVKAIDPDDTLKKPLSEAIQEEEGRLNRRRIKLRKMALSRGDIEADQEDTIEMEVPPETLEPKKAGKGRLVVYANDKRQRPFGYFVGLDKSGRIRVKRFDGVFVRRISQRVVVLV